MMATTGATMADWLALHGLTAEDCRRVLEGMPIGAPHRAPDPAYASDTLQSDVLDALERTIPAAGPILDRIKAEVRIDLAPDITRFPRAFTLHDDGRGVPFISCPVKGRLSDLLLLAHEVGHACQIMASGRIDLPPMLRETAAYTAEELVCAGIANADLGVALSSVHLARTSRIMNREGRALLQALDSPAATYNYGWNYPIARILAARHRTADIQWAVFAGETELSALTDP